MSTVSYHEGSARDRKLAAGVLEMSTVAGGRWDLVQGGCYVDSRGNLRPIRCSVSEAAASFRPLHGTAQVTGVSGRVGCAIELRDGIVRESLEPTGSGSCIWTAIFELNALVPNANIRDAWIEVTPAATPRDDLKQLPTTSDIRGPSQLGYEFVSCPASVNDIRHGPLNITYVAGSTKTRSAELDW